MSEVIHLSTEDCERRRSAALARLGMTLDEARSQWDECGCCLVNGNWDALLDLEEVKSMDWLLDEGAAL